MTSKHTPGPWRTSLNINGVDYNIRSGSNVVATVWFCPPEGGDASTRANLIAAAPDMLRFLRALYSTPREELDEWRSALLARIDGEQG